MAVHEPPGPPGPVITSCTERRVNSAGKKEVVLWEGVTEDVSPQKVQ